MKAHSTNYTYTFILVAEDCPAAQGIEPPVSGGKQSMANLQFDLLHNNPYKFTSDDVLFGAYAAKNDLPEAALALERQKFFSKGQPCFRASPLTKRYGWGVHCDASGKIALYGVETAAYESYAESKDLKLVKAMRSKRK